jgi:ankyrin repeat protein
MLFDRPGISEEERAELKAAMEQEDVDQIQQRVRRNPALVNTQDKNGRTPLHFATWEENADFARFLLNNHATVDVRDKWGRTPLSVAIYEEPLVFNHVPTVSLLLGHGADVNARDDSGNTPLHLATFLGTEVVPLLLEQGADVKAVNDAGETPLHKAVRYPEYESVRELLRHGADKSIRNAEGLTPVQIAEKRGWTNLVELLSAAVEREAVR